MGSTEISWACAVCHKKTTTVDNAPPPLPPGEGCGDLGNDHLWGGHGTAVEGVRDAMRKRAAYFNKKAGESDELRQREALAAAALGINVEMLKLNAQLGRGVHIGAEHNIEGMKLITRIVMALAAVVTIELGVFVYAETQDAPTCAEEDETDDG